MFVSFNNKKSALDTSDRLSVFTQTVFCVSQKQFHNAKSHCKVLLINHFQSLVDTSRLGICFIFSVSPKIYFQLQVNQFGFCNQYWVSKVRFKNHLQFQLFSSDFVANAWQIIVSFTSLNLTFHAFKSSFNNSFVFCLVSFTSF